MCAFMRLSFALRSTPRATSSHHRSIYMDSTTTVRIGQTANGSVTIDSTSGVLSQFAYIGNTSGYTGEFSVNGAGSTWTNASRLYDGFYGTGTLNITGGGVVNNDFACLGYYADSVGTAKVDGKDSKWTNTSDLYVGYGATGPGNHRRRRSQQRHRFIGYDADPPTSISTGRVYGDGTNSKWTNNADLAVGYYGNGTLNITGGGAVAATSVYVSSLSLLAIDVGNGSQLAVNNGTGAITYDGAVRILAGANAASGIAYTPITATSWSGGGTCQPIGGTWNATVHSFTASVVQSGTSGNQLTINLKDIQRLLIDGSLGASFAQRLQTPRSTLPPRPSAASP